MTSARSARSPPVNVRPPLFSTMCSEYLAPSLFLNHGSGPNPILGAKSDIAFADFMKNVHQIIDFNLLKAIIVVTAHREEDIVTISSGKHHDLIYDYSNFPAESYTYKYEAEGHPALAQRLQEAFLATGLAARLDATRGWDHGLFVPMMLINPAANIPVVQLSILNNHHSEQHYNIGQVLHQFRKEGIAIIGSGMSYHNMSEFKKARIYNDGKVVNEEFDKFLNDVCMGDLRKRKEILQWDKALGGLEAHPPGEADHLMPLIVCAGAGGAAPGKNVFQTIFVEKFKMSGFMWNKE